jgi:hypothetical protein
MPDGNELAGSGMEQRYRVGLMLGHLSIKRSALQGFDVSARISQNTPSVISGCIRTPILRPFSGHTHDYVSIDTQPLQAVRATDQVQYLVGMVISFLPHSLRQ